jgi:UDP-N-acetylglucosamine 2-epimerase
VHRPSNTDDAATLRGILRSFADIDTDIVFPLHPRTRNAVSKHGLGELLDSADNIISTAPLGFLDFVKLMRHARFILTDSGGVQKEACFHRVPCITLRNDTEWVETIEWGWNALTGPDPEKIADAVRTLDNRAPRDTLPTLWDGHAAKRIIEVIRREL